MMKRIVILIGIIIIIISSNAIILSAETGTSIVTDDNQDKEEAEEIKKLVMVPINPKFIDYLEKSNRQNYGYMPPPMNLSHIDELSTDQPVKTKDLPNQFDWRDFGKVTSIKNQSPCGTCWCFGTTSVLESSILMNNDGKYDLSEQSVALCVDHSWVCLYDDPTDPCMAGGNSFIATDVFTKKGAVLESCNPYDCSALNCDGSCICDNCPPVKNVEGIRYVTGDGSQINIIKNAIFDHGPVTVSFGYDPNYLYYDSTYGNIYDYCNCDDFVNHLVSIIGWDDDVPHPCPGHSGTGAWLVKNSWGPEWGNDGYFYLAYGSSCVTEVAYYSYEVPNPHEELVYLDEAGYVGSVGYNLTSAWMANVFTAPQSGEITHVDFWTTSNDVQYEIYIWGGYFESELINQAGSCSECGYYSIPLNDPVSIDAGEQFTVGVNMTTTGYGYPIPVEAYIENSVEPPIQLSKSFLSYSGTSWTDIGDEYQWNACLRARIGSNGGICGDVDESGTVNIRDVRLLMNHVVDPGSYPVDEQIGNVNGVGGIDASDVILLVRHVFNPIAYPLTC